MTVSANGGYGIRIAGNAHNNTVFHTYIGTNFNATTALGNRLGGISLGAGTSTTSIGGAGPLQDQIEFNGGNGVTIASSVHDAILGDVIAANLGYGIYATGLCTGTLIANNTIWINAAGVVNLAASRGILYVP